MQFTSSIRFLIWIFVLLPTYAHAQAEGLVLYYAFDSEEKDVITDWSGTGNHATIRGKPTWTDGKIGKAIQFEAIGDYLEAPDSDSLRPDEITISLWLNWSGQKLPSMIIEKFTYDLAGYLFKMEGNVTGMWLYDKMGNRFIYPASPIPTPGEWTHLAVTFDGAVQRAYVNGVEARIYGNRPMVWAGPIGHTDAPLKMGSYMHEYTFTGMLDEVAIYNRPLTEEEILQTMENGHVPPPTVAVESKRVNPGEQFTVDISARLKATSLHRFAFDLTFEPSVLQVVRVKDGPFLSRDGIDATSWEILEVDNKKGGIANIGCRRTGKEGVANSTGVLAVVTFKAIRAGSGRVSVENLRLLGPNKEKIAALTQVGSVDVFPHGSISGIVIDAESKTPIPRVEITVSNQWFQPGAFGFSDEAGRYTIDGVPVGIFDVVASRPAITHKIYPPTTAEVHVKPG
jgi:hypothetical protein